MKHIWKLLTLALVLTLALTVMPRDAQAASGTCGANLNWKYDEVTHTITISGKGPMTNYEVKGAPWYDFASEIKTLVIEEGVTTVGSYAFYKCSNLGNITIPSTVSKIMYGCFGSIMNGFTGEVHISDLSAWCNIEKYGNGVSDLLQNAELFLNGEYVEDLVIPSGVRELEGAFECYSRLKSVIIPESVLKISGGTFHSSQNLHTVVFLGDAPSMNAEQEFRYSNTTCYYPAGNDTWTNEYIEQFGGGYTWIPYEATSDFYFARHPEKPVFDLEYMDYHAVLRALAVGDGVSYQWQYRADEYSDWTDMACDSATKSELQMDNSTEFTGQVRCAATDGRGYKIYSDVSNLDQTYLYTESTKRVEDTFRYLNEIYIEKYPRLGLRFKYGSEKNREELLTLAETITAECTTDKEKADAIVAWIGNNMQYNDKVYLPYSPSATWYYRLGVCFNDAVLMEALLRLEGIPAVWATGWGCNTQNTTEMIFSEVGHAWCWAYLDGEWVLYETSPDLRSGTTDRDWMSKWRYFYTIEGIVPVYDTDVMPSLGLDEGSSGLVYYKNAFRSLTESGKPSGAGGQLVNNALELKAYSYINQSVQYLDTALGTNMQKGELFRNGFVTDWRNIICFVYENGIGATDTVLAINGERYLVVASMCADRLLIPETDYFLLDDVICVSAGYSGKIIESISAKGYREKEGYILSWTSNNRDVATVDETGVITAITSGDVEIVLKIVDDSNGMVLETNSYWIRVLENGWNFDYTDHSKADTDEEGNHVHKYVASVEMPGCDKDGLTTYICNCGDTFTRGIKAYGHDYYGISCEDGKITIYGCVICGDTYATSVGHSYNSTITAPTCTEQGYTTYTCDCGEIFVDTYVEALGHSWDKGVLVVEPTEADEGMRSYSCSACGEVKTETIPELNHVHKYTETVTAPTCEKRGYTTHACRCGDSYKDTYVDAAGHTTELQGAIPATCTKQGFRGDLVCVTCGKITDHGYYFPAWGHDDHIDQQKDATCTEDGLTEGKHCTRCGTVLVAQRSIQAKGHSWSDWAVTREATEQEKGEKRRACSDCNEVEVELIPTLVHVHEHVGTVIVPTCSELGYTIHICACGDSYVDTHVEALGHSWGDWRVTKEATDAENGEKQRICAVCGEIQMESIPVLVPVNPFVDVPENKFFFKPVLWAVEQGITSGTGDGTTFSPNSECTRGQIVMFLWRAAGKPEPTATESPFPDVTPGNSYYKAIMWAVEKGITSGQKDGTFGIKVPCNRQQTVMFLWRYAGKPEPTMKESPFPDVTAGNSFSKAIFWAVESGITTGLKDGRFDPQGTCTRGQIVTFLYRHMVKE